MPIAEMTAAERLGVSADAPLSVIKRGYYRCALKLYRAHLLKRDYYKYIEHTLTQSAHAHTEMTHTADI